MSTLTKALVAAVLALGLAVAVQSYRLRSAHRATAAAAIAPAKEAVKEADAAGVVATAQVDTAAQRLAKRMRVVTRIIHDTVPVPAAVLQPVTRADTAAAVAAVPVLAQQFGACREQLAALTSDCVAYRAAAEARFRTDSASIARRDTVITKQNAVIAGGLSPRRLSLGVTLGYGATLARDSTRAFRLYTGPSLTTGLTWTPF